MMAENAEDIKQVSVDRYPGIRPFRKGESSLFFGRDSEVEELLHSIKAHDTMVLYSKSGLGKSSLVNAGLSPRLIEEDFFPIDIRFHTSADQRPIEKIRTAVREHMSEEVLKSIPDSLQNELWILFSQWGRPGVPVLIFDQFEEFFYYRKEWQDQVIDQLAKLMRPKVPRQVLKKAMAEEKESEFSPDSLVDKPPVKLLFLIRSDRLSLLGDLAQKLPQIFSNRYHLKPLRMERAEEAISMPAQLFGSGEISFNSPTYEYRLDSLNVILKSLRNSNNEIESSQLQIVCQELEKIAQAKAVNADGEVEILPDDFGGEKGIRKIINGFYWNQLTKLRTNEKLPLNDADIRVVRNLIENELLSGNKRIIQSADRVHELLKQTNPHQSKIDGVDRELLLVDELLNLRLIREEESHLGKVFEISHDTLVESIVTAREERDKLDKAEKLKQQEKELEEERRRLDREIKLKEKARDEREKALAAEKEALRSKEEAVAAEQKARASEREALAAKAEAVRLKNEAESAWHIALQEESKAKEEKDKAVKARTRLRLVLVVMVLLFIGVVVLLLYANDNRITRRLNIVNAYIKEGNYEQAKKELSLDQSRKGLLWLVNYPGLGRYELLAITIDSLADLGRRYDSLIDLAARFKNERGDSLRQAYDRYQLAANLKYVPADYKRNVTQLMNQLKEMMNQSFVKYINKAEAFLLAGDMAASREALQVATSLKIDGFLPANELYDTKYEKIREALSGQ